MACPLCRVPAGRRCIVLSWGQRSAIAPHKRRVRLALAVRAHADPALDEHWAHHGSCLLCGVPGLGARHRRIDAVAAMLEAGEIWEEISGEMDVTMEAIDAVEAWMKRWPGAWL